MAHPGAGLQLMTNGWSSMGFGVPAAIAAKLCLPDRKVACVTGDGGFLMMAGEMATARRLKLPVVFVVLSDRRLELIRLKQERKSFQRYGTDLCDEGCPSADHVFGVPVLRAERRAEHTARPCTRPSAMDGPVIVEAEIRGADYAELIMRKHK